jgi:hypothetical protein
MNTPAFKSGNPDISDFSCKSFKIFVDANDHINCSFTLYFKGKRAASYALDPWSGESKVTYVSLDMKDEINEHAKANGLIDAAKNSYIESMKEIFSEERAIQLAEERDFSLEDVIDALRHVFQSEHEDKKFNTKIKRLCKNSIVVGNKEEYIPLTIRGVRDFSELKKFKNGQEVLEKTFSRAKELVQQNSASNYEILNTSEQLVELNLMQAM